MLVTIPPETNVHQLNQLLQLGGLEITTQGSEYVLKTINPGQPSQRVTAEDLRTGKARLVREGGNITVERAPAGSQFRIPMPEQKKEADNVRG